MTRTNVVLNCALLSLLLLAAGGWCGETTDEDRLDHVDVRELVLVANETVAGFGADCRVVHDYGDFSLVRMSGRDVVAAGADAHPLPSGERVSFRGWSGRVPARSNVPEGSEAVLVVRLVGPLDRDWRSEFEAIGVEVVAAAHPHALVVRADGPSLDGALRMNTSEGFPVILGYLPLPLEARVHRSLASALQGGEVYDRLELSGYGGRALGKGAKAAAAAFGSVGVENADLRTLLLENQDIGYAEPVFGKRLHNNLAVRAELVDVEALWALGYTGEGVVVSHNDSGVDLEHPDLASAVIASFGRMAYTDTAHGTHTAGSIVGRGRAAAPENSSGCGDLIQGSDQVSGMAPSAKIVTNNIFTDGFGEVAEMMAWGSGHGAHLSSNSWGLLGQSGPEVGYTSAAVQADTAVRDADPDTPGNQPLTVFFSAGNTGPGVGTITSPGTAKNVITVGATQNARCGAWVPTHQPGPDNSAVLDSSGRGPSQGRIKPDLVAPGSDVLSLESGDDYAVQPWDEGWTGPELALNTGTSQACAVAAGAGAVLHEALWRTRGRRPSPALLKAVITVGAEPGPDGVDVHRGWGGIDLEGVASGAQGGELAVFDQIETAELNTGERWTDEIVVRSASVPLVLVVVWTDVPGEEDAAHALVNDLDVVLTGPSGAVFRGNVLVGPWSRPNPGNGADRDNNVEVVRVQAPEVGSWTLEVVGVNVPVAPPGLTGQDFALVYAGDAGPCAEPPPPPASVQAAADGANRIRVDWTSVAGATRYEISRALNSGGHPYEPIGVASPGTTSFVDTDVSGDIDYFYVVRAERSCWSVYSIEAGATGTGSCLLGPVFEGLESAESPGAAGCDIRLDWEPAVGPCPEPVVYDIYRSTDPGFEPGPDNRVLEDFSGSSWLDRGLEGGLDHYYVVRSRHAGVGMDDGNLVILGALPTGPNDVYLSADAEGSSDGWIREPASAADSGTEPWGTTDDDAWNGERSWFVPDEDRVKDQVLLTAEPIDLPAGTDPVLEFHHRFRLHQGGDGGRLEYSTNGGLDWQDILAGDGQTVTGDAGRWRSGGYTATIGGIGNPLYGEDGWTGDSDGWLHSVVDLGALAGQRVLLRWRFGCDESAGSGWGWWLDEILLSVENECWSCVSPDPPVGLSAAPISDGVALSWAVSAGAAEYRISRSTKSEGPFEKIATVEAPLAEFNDTSASGGTAYTYVLAVDTGCLSGPSAAVTVTAGGPCTLAPMFWGLDGVKDRREPGCALDLHWREAEPSCDGAGIDYRVYRSREAEFEPGPDNLIADRVAGPRFRDTNVADGELYHYRVRAVDGVSLREDANPVEHSGWTTGPQEVHFSDSVEGDLTSWWTGIGSPSDTGTEPWRVDDLASDGERSWFCSNEPVVKDQVVGLVDAFRVVDPTTVLVFDHLFDLEAFWDGGRLEYSTDGGASWHDILSGDGAAVPDNSERFVRGGYTGIASPGTGHPFGGQRVWTGFNGVWTETTVDLGDFVGQTVLVRWRLGCDRTDARLGWWIDKIELRTTTTCESIGSPPPRESQGRRF